MPTQRIVPGRVVALAATACLTCWGAGARAAEPTTRRVDAALQRADQFIARSDRYLHHSRLRRGMTGYGLTVMSGTTIETFHATVVSVLTNYAPHQDVILCRLSGLGLDNGGIVAGMSGSPVFITDPQDGKSKLIGAVAYGWSFQKEPLCGVQPIAQMLAIGGVPLPGAGAPATAPAPAQAAAVADEDFVRAMLRPDKTDFAALVLPRRADRPGAGASGEQERLVPLPLPVAVSGPGRRSADLADRTFAQAGLLPVQAGSVAGLPPGGPAGHGAQARLEPGSAFALPLVTGDGDWTAVGTVTDVIPSADGDFVLALGHSFNAEGATELPMGTGYVHAVVSSLGRSFKVASRLEVTGALISDEYTAVGGRVGQKVTWIPMDVTVRRGQAVQQYHFNLARHRQVTPTLAGLMLIDSVLAQRDLPEQHTLDYSVSVEFPLLPGYRAVNRSSDSLLRDVRSDLVRPLAAMMNNALGQPVAPEAIRVEVTIEAVRRTAEVVELKLQRNEYRPGQTVRGQVVLKPFRAERQAVGVSLPLPEDLPDGKYVLTAGGASVPLRAMQEEAPHRFAPRTPEQLLQALQRVVEPRQDRLYLHLPLPASGVAVRRQEIPSVPGSVADLLLRAAPADANLFRASRTTDVAVDCVVTGEAQATITVQAEPGRKDQ